MVLIYISLMNSDVEHLSMCLPSVCLWRSVSLFMSSAHFLIGLFGCLMLNYWSSSYILDINPLSDISFDVNIFSYWVGYLFLLLMVNTYFFLIQDHFFLFLSRLVLDKTSFPLTWSGGNISFLVMWWFSRVNTI